MEFNEWKEAAIEGVLEKQIFKSSYGKCSIKKLFLHISQNSQQKSVPEWSWRPQSGTLLKKRPWQSDFRVNFAKFLRTSFWQNTFGRLLLDIPQNTCSAEYQPDYMVKIFTKCQWRMPFLVKLNRPTACNFNKNGTLSQT